MTHQNVVTYIKYRVMQYYTQNLSLKEKRYIFQNIRNLNTSVNSDYFMPTIGLTLGEFSLFQILNESSRRKNM